MILIELCESLIFVNGPVIQMCDKLDQACVVCLLNSNTL